MGINFSPFEIGRRALVANQLGLTVAGQNIANVNTPGYTRQAVQLSGSPPDGSNLGLVGTGVTIDGVRSFRDRFIESRLRTETAITGRLTARRDSLAPVDEAFNETNGSGVGTAMNNFFGAFRDLEAHPSSMPLRTAVVERGTALAQAFNSLRSRLSGLRKETDEGVRAAVDDVNALASRVAELNANIASAEHSGGNASELRDQRGELVRQLSELAGVRSVEDESGMLTLSFADGQPLVVGNQANALTATSTPPDGLSSITLDGNKVAIGDGRLRGLLDSMSDIAGQIGSLDALAAEITERVNTLHTSGTDSNGTAGVNFFAVPTDGSPVNAANFAVSSAVRADAHLVVASPLAAASGASTIAGEIANLLTDTNSTAGARTGSFSSIYASMVRDAGASVADSDSALNTQQAILAQVTAQRDSVSGVSLDEEAINLLQFQRSYEAAARFLKIADEMTQTILALGQ